MDEKLFETRETDEDNESRVTKDSSSLLETKGSFKKAALSSNITNEEYSFQIFENQLSENLGKGLLCSKGMFYSSA